jgi:hypothetical protein
VEIVSPLDVLRLLSLGLALANSLRGLGQEIAQALTQASDNENEVILPPLEEIPPATLELIGRMVVGETKKAMEKPKEETG